MKKDKYILNLFSIIDDLLNDLRSLFFGLPVAYIYNPLEYARKSYEQYVLLYAGKPKEIILLGMNPGPWGMAQTGIPFGEVKAVKEWLHIESPVMKPSEMHPKRPVMGFNCPRSEVSGKRLWGWAKKKFDTPERFFSRFFVANYCPLLFIETSGRNRTPNNLRAAERKHLFAACDRALRRTIQSIKPRYVVGVGQFAEKRAHIALSRLNVTIGAITHPSPANPRANQGWDDVIERELKALGIHVP
ncbi:MAG: uracil-DNA glycosylase family protein [Candidatus Hodarchaeota archaeon]